MILQNTISKQGFDLVYKGDTFKCAFITQSDQYVFGKVLSMKRHNESDEVFALIRGKAVLLTGEPTKKQFTRTELQTGTVYCVEAGTWHYLAVTEDAMVFVGENSTVSKENTDEINLEEENIVLEI